MYNLDVGNLAVDMARLEGVRASVRDGAKLGAIANAVPAVAVV